MAAKIAARKFTSSLPVCFCQIARPTERLQIFKCGRPTLGKRNDVVNVMLHLPQIGPAFPKFAWPEASGCPALRTLRTTGKNQTNLFWQDGVPTFKKLM
jgi:hypothetical protein